MTEWNLSMYGINSAGSMKNRMKWPRMKSAAKKPISVILHRNSRPGCDIECQPMEYHFPVHHAMLEVSARNSRVSARAMISLKMKRWMATTAIMPSRVFAKLKPSRKYIDLEQGQEHDDGDAVSDGGKHGAELLAAHAEERAHTASHAEEANGHTGVDGDGSERDDGECG